MSQAPTDALMSEARAAADFLDLEFEYRFVGYGLLEPQIANLKIGGGAHV